MGHWCKHIAVRLWTAFTLGALTALILLPPFAGTIGPGWMILPGAGLLVAAYWLVGIGFSAMGHRRMNRLMEEATVWERAGMDREVRQVLDNAADTVDSFFFSPLSRKAPAKRLLAKTARFQFSRTSTEPPTEGIIEAYLESFPQDRNTAIQWLDQVLTLKKDTERTHDIAAAIKDAHKDDSSIVQMVARLYLNERRCDFTALQTYRDLMDFGRPLPDDLVIDMAGIFLSHSRTDPLALTIYLDRFERGDRNLRLIQGLAACVQSIHSGPSTRPLLKRADAVLAKIEGSRRKLLAEAFLPDPIDLDSIPTRKSRRISLPAIVRIIRQRWTGWKAGVAAFASRFSRKMRNMGRGIRSNRVKSVLKWLALGVSMAGVTWLVINTVLHLSTPSKTAETPPAATAPPVIDYPFTIQVAAYLKESDAKRYVENLKKSGLDAYWTRTSGERKTWYQVRIFHFETKAAAKAFGEDLKARGLIDDYYVANYNPN